VFAQVSGFWWLLLVYVVFSLVREPTRPLLDGIFFSSQRSIPALAEVSYHRVRIWGSVGFMIPSACLAFVLTDQDALGHLPLLSCVLALVGIVAAYFLPTRRRRGVPGVGVGAGVGPGTGEGAGADPGQGRPADGGANFRVLLRSTARLLSRRRTVVFLLAMFVLQASVSAYFAFYPLLATETMGLAPRWLGLVMNLAVGLELGYMAAFGWFVRRLGWKWLMVLGALGAGVRVALLAAVPTVGVLFGAQVVHGLVIIVTMVAGRVLLDRQAPDEIRHTAQGLYAMIVLGGGRVAGSGLGGLVAAQALEAVFWTAAAAAVVAAVMLAWTLRDEKP
jgi:PPP family 3-phenylpropionic acid transporter